MATVLQATNFENAFLQHDYPFGRRIRCLRKCWLEYKPKFGYRFCTCTTKRSWNHSYSPAHPPAEIPGPALWNKPKCSTYSDFAILTTGEKEGVEDYVCCHRLNYYTAVEDIKKFHDRWYGSLSHEQQMKFQEFLREYQRANRGTLISFTVGGDE